MKFNFRRFVTGFLLFAGGNLSLTQALTVDDFNSYWDNEGDNTYYSGDVVGWTGSPMRGCVTGARQWTGFFENEGDVEIRKLVRPTSTPGIFDVHVLLRGKRVTQTRNDLNVCSVVVFDKSGSMKNGYNGGSDTKRTDAVSGAVEFSNILISGNDNSKVGLVFFAATASVKKSLDHEALSGSLFSFTPSGETNIQDGLVKAGNMLSGADCDAKYIILMSDGDANRYGPSGSSTSGSILGPSMAKETASELKEQGIVVYSIGYDLKTDTARNTLKNIAQDSGHYFDASGANISDIFQDIGNVTVELNAGVSSSLNDEIGGAMLRMGDIEISSGAQITDPGAVYSFQIKIKPDVTGFQPSNDGLTLSYIDVNNDTGTLSIDSDHTAEIYWTAPKCEGSLPGGTSVVVGSDEFTQTWSGTVLVPETKEWVYTGGSVPGECEWTCNDVNYGGNPNTNTCELKVIVDFDVNGGTGNIPSQTVISGMNADEPGVEPTRTGYQFSGWTLNDEKFILPGAVTGNITLKAFRVPNKYEIKFNGNGSTNGSMSNQKLTYDETGTLSDNKFSKKGYHFTGWNTKADGSGTWYENQAEVNNLATGGVVKLFAQWEPNTYTIVFDGNGATNGTMSPLETMYDNDIKLTKNGYSKNGSKFLGWNTSPDGKGTAYTDEQVVKNLATTGEVTLYAQWEKLGSSGGGGRSSSSYACKNLPSNVEVNNTLKPSGKDVDYYYSADVSKACTFQCKLGYVWNEQTKNCEIMTEEEPEPEPTPVVPSRKCSIEGSTHSAEVNEAYLWACERGIIKSKTITGAKLGEFLNRAEMAKIVTIFEMIELGAKPDRSKDCSAFADSISDYNQQMKDYMVTSCQLERMGIHTADYTPISDFMPRKFVSRAEFGTILSRILWEDKYEASKNSAYYYVDHLNRLKSNGILTNINPNLVERRSYAILMIYRAAKMMGKI